MAFWGAAAFVILAEKLVDNEEQFHFALFYAAILFLAPVYGLYLSVSQPEMVSDGVF